MKNLKKKIFVTLLGLSNLAVLGSVFHTYFTNNQTSYLFSTSIEDEKSLKEKIKKECKKSLQELIEGKRLSFICNAKVYQRYKGASYFLKVQFRVQKNTDGSITIKEQGQIKNPTQHATEADFCNDCSKTNELLEGSFPNLMNQVLAMAEDVYFEAQGSVRKAQEEYNKKDSDNRMASLKEKNCDGSWNEDREKFEEFDTEERFQCKMEKISQMKKIISQMKSHLDTENYYHNELKNELWETALLSEDEYILDGMLDKFSGLYRSSWSAQSSLGLIKSYLSWKDDFEVLDSLEQKNRFLKGIKTDVDQMIKHIGAENSSQTDLKHLNEGFDELFVRLNQPTNSIPSLHPAAPSTKTNVPLSPAIDYGNVKKQIQNLY